MANPVKPEVTVGRDELIASLRSVASLVKPANKAQAVMSYANGALSIDLPGLSASIPAIGSWSGTARFSAGFLLSLARTPADNGTVTLRVENGRLDAGTIWITCDWEESPPVTISLPLNGSLRTMLSVAYHFTSDEIARAGLTRPIAEAQAKRDIRLHNALLQLEEFGVTATELRILVDKKMRAMPKP